MFILKIPSWNVHRCLKVETSSVDWAKPSRFYLMMETECSIRNVFRKINRTVFLSKDRKKNNVQKHNVGTKQISSSQVTYQKGRKETTVLPSSFSRHLIRVHYRIDRESGFIAFR